MNIFHKRQGQMDISICYFYTDTINNFMPLLANDDLKLIVIQSLQYLVRNEFVKIYGYVIMPNHIHILWYLLKLNGKESAAGSFAKYTAHQFKKYLKNHQPSLLEKYRSGKGDRQYQFWKRDPLAIPVSSESILIQKLEYIHQNPVREKWALSK